MRYANKCEQTPPEHLNPVANEFEDEQEDDGVLVLGIDVGENKIERAGAETVADHI